MLDGNMKVLKGGEASMVGLIVSVAAVFALLFMCASITKENTEKAVRKHHENWEN